MKLVHDYLELAYFVSQIVLASIALIAAFFAFAQLRTFKFFEILRFVEQPHFRRARRFVIRNLGQRIGERWWVDGDDAEQCEEAATEVCARYDVVARVIEFDRFDRYYGKFFQRHWARSIFLTHHILKDFIEYRRKDYPEQFKAYSRLAEKCDQLLPASAKRPTYPRKAQVESPDNGA